MLILSLNGHHEGEELDDDVLAAVRGWDVVVPAGHHDVGRALPVLAVCEVTVVRVVYSTSYYDVVMELIYSSEIRAPPDIVEGGAAYEDVGGAVSLQSAEVGDVRVADGKYLSGAGITLRHRLGGKYPGLGHSHDGRLGGGRVII